MAYAYQAKKRHRADNDYAHCRFGYYALNFGRIFQPWQFKAYYQFL